MDVLPREVICACCGQQVYRADAYPYIHRIDRYTTTTIHKCLDCHHAWAAITPENTRAMEPLDGF